MYYILELIRLLAVVLITFTHTRNDFTPGDITYVIFEELPKVGTIILSIISGFLFIKVSKNKDNLFLDKIKTLLIPFLLANFIVLSLVLFFKFTVGFNFLNRLTFDYKLITEGLLSLNSPPINPPTYFIRDIFVLFILIELVRNTNLKMLFLIIPLVIFGKLFLRLDIPILFSLGVVIGYFSNYVIRYKSYILSTLLIFFLLYIQIFSFKIDILKYIISFFIFILVFNLKIKFYNVGAYCYLIHLYHSPIIVSSFPIISKFTTNTIYNVLIQIITVLIFSYFIFLTTRSFKKLKILTGNK